MILLNDLERASENHATLNIRYPNTHLMIQEKLGEKAKMLTVDFAKMTVHFEYGNVVLTVDLISGWLRIPAALSDVPLKYSPTFHVFQAKLANEEFRQARVLLRIRRRVPSLNLKDAELDGRRISTRRWILLIEDRQQRLDQTLGAFSSLSAKEKGKRGDKNSRKSVRWSAVPDAPKLVYIRI